MGLFVDILSNSWRPNATSSPHPAEASGTSSAPLPSLPSAASPPPRPPALSEGMPRDFVRADRATPRYIKNFRDELVSNILPKDGCCVGASIVQSRCAEEGAAVKASCGCTRRLDSCIRQGIRRTVSRRRSMDGIMVSPASIFTSDLPETVYDNGFGARQLPASPNGCAGQVLPHSGFDRKLRKLDLYRNGGADPAARTEPRIGRSPSMAARDDDQKPVGSCRHGDSLFDNFLFGQEILDESAGLHGFSEFTLENQILEFFDRGARRFP